VRKHLKATYRLRDGYAESVIAIPSGLASIPDNFSSAAAAPMLCAGVTMFNALRRSSAEPGDLVAVQGVGGLGHLAVQFAARMGFRVAAIARGPEKEEFARQLGADHYIDSKAGDPVAALQALGGAKVIVATASDSKSMSELFGGLAPRGRMIVAGAGNSPIEVSPMLLLFGSRGIEGTFTGSSFDSEETLTFSVLHRVKPMIETVPLQEAAEGYQRMLSNKARFRMVIVMGQ
jgi:D-arabinose 1-dehydrogenase-like Zn-dependent alcohol dehydrogenase